MYDPAAHPPVGRRVPHRVLNGGLTVFPLGAGCWPIGGPGTNRGVPMGWSTAEDTASREGLETAYELGVNLFDTADIYGHGHSERLLGSLLRQVPRASVVISSKVGYFSGTAAHGYLPSHMRRQLETTLENLGTDHLDIYHFHHPDFGPGDRHLDAAIAQMRSFQAEGLIRCVGLRGPHRLASERTQLAPDEREDKHARFRRLFAAVRPDFLAVRYNALTPPPGPGQEDLFAFAAAHGTSVLINKPLGQGLLTGKYHPDEPTRFGEGDHRLRKRWFTSAALDVVHQELDPLRRHFGPTTANLVRAALGACLRFGEHTAVLAGFTSPEQVRENVAAVHHQLTAEELTLILTTAQSLQHRLNTTGEVFVDEKAATR
ncbi:aldo/keto reductase [Streptomyces europaeiscabiei]|uniref:aldo/keto reductase n=1 Tax=Streptomyces europaeiscabiei TaxID=146819 RepID=UPI002E17055F